MNNSTFKQSSVLVLQILVVLIGIGVLALMLWMPHIEGRNAKATAFEIYFNDPFLAYVYVGSIPFFVALYRAFGLLGHVRKIGTFSQATVEGLLAIKRCAWALIGFVAGAAVLIILIVGDNDDRPAGVFMCLLFTVAASAVAVAAAILARRLQKTLGRSEGGLG